MKCDLKTEQTEKKESLLESIKTVATGMLSVCILVWVIEAIAMIAMAPLWVIQYFFFK